ncbi:hypothetical protein IFO70_10425 [Phormidium tenue FACHB-886]|nr:hypothetical protein [Phormidium tenue FACHB-886]
MSKFLDFLGTSANSFLIAIGGVRLKNSTGNLLVRNPGDTADAQITASKLNNTGNTISIGSTNVLNIQQNAGQTAGLTVIYPTGKATDGQVLAQKAGTAANVIEFEFVSAANTATCLTTDTTSFAFGSSGTVPMFTLPANAVVEAVRVIVDTVFNGAPSMSVGTSGSPSKYMASTQVDLKDAAGAKIYEVYPGLTPVGTAEALQIAYTPGGATAGAARVEVDYVVPS